jgi:16S rRNA (guanine527-N7)-methyltransferase
MIANEEEAIAWLRLLPEFDPSAEQRLRHFVRMLGEENQQQNLVSANSLSEVWRRHIADSAQLLQFVPRETMPWLDLGTGAGFPGLVVAALRPRCPVILIESRARRIAWLEQVRQALGLDAVEIIGDRLEKVAARKVGVISARAFAPLPRLIALSARFSTSETIWVLPKGRSAQQELQELGQRSHAFHVEQSVTDADSGIIVGRLTGRKEAA